MQGVNHFSQGVKPPTPGKHSPAGVYVTTEPLDFYCINFKQRVKNWQHLAEIFSILCCYKQQPFNIAGSVCVSFRVTAQNYRGSGNSAPPCIYIYMVLLWVCDLHITQKNVYVPHAYICYHRFISDEGGKKKQRNPWFKTYITHFLIFRFRYRC